MLQLCNLVMTNEAEKKKYEIDYGRNKQLQINKIIN
jgi:hypothetical protein